MRHGPHHAAEKSTTTYGRSSCEAETVGEATHECFIFLRRLNVLVEFSFGFDNCDGHDAEKGYAKTDGATGDLNGVGMKRHRTQSDVAYRMNPSAKFHSMSRITPPSIVPQKSRSHAPIPSRQGNALPPRASADSIRDWPTYIDVDLGSVCVHAAGSSDLEKGRRTCFMQVSTKSFPFSFSLSTHSIQFSRSQT